MPSSWMGREMRWLVGAIVVFAVLWMIAGWYFDWPPPIWDGWERR
jgi:hypothetical protein